MITRTRHTRNYTVVPNRIHRELAPDARLYLTFLLAQKPSYRPHTTRDAPRVGVGRNRLRAASRELVAKGYMTRLQTRRPNGRYGWRTVVYDTPCDQGERDITAGQTRDRLSVPGVHSSVSTNPPGSSPGSSEGQMEAREPDPMWDGEVKTKPTAKRATVKKCPAVPAMSAYGLAEKFARKQRLYYPDSSPPNGAALGGNFAHWHRAWEDEDGREIDGLRFEVIDLALTLFFNATQGKLFAPADKVFIKQRHQWIEQARGIYYQEVELPRLKQAHEDYMDAWYAELEALDPGRAQGLLFTPSDAVARLKAAGQPVPAWNG